jgi:cytochrome c553
MKSSTPSCPAHTTHARGTTTCKNVLPIRLLAIFISALLASSARAQPLEERLPTCFACHGENGQSQLPDVPSLGAQPALYSLIQLVMFRDRLRVSDPMNDMAKGLSDNELRAAADVISKLPAPAPVEAGADSARMERARALGAQHRCDFCHQREYHGAENVPRLAGQREDYLLKTLRAYKDNSRRGYDSSMSDVVYPIKDEDFVELAYFLARVK